MQNNKLLSLWSAIRYKKQGLLVVPVAVLLCCAAVTTVAWLTKSDDTTNAFTVGSVSAEVEETFPDPYSTKTNVKVKNTGNVDAYVRAYVSIYLQKTDGTVLARKPEEGAGKDYTIQWGDSQNWKKQGDIYYYLCPVKPDGTTENLIDQVVQYNSEDGVQLVVDISTQVIQASPAKAVEDAWNVTVGADGTLTPPATQP